MRVQTVKNYCNWRQAKEYQAKLEEKYKYVRMVTRPFWNNVKCIYEWEIK